MFVYRVTEDKWTRLLMGGSCDVEEMFTRGQRKIRDVVGKSFREVVRQKCSAGCERDIRGVVEND